MLISTQQQTLIEIVQETIKDYILNNEIKSFKITDPVLNEKRGAFITLKMNDELRGCIGQILPSGKPLWEVVRDMAIEAATGDPRFNPVSKEDLDSLEYEISVLSVPREIKDYKEIELGKHGVIVKKDWHTGVFLPQVATETGWDLETFMEELCSQKAGLDPDSYKNDPEVKIFVFEAEVF